MYNSNFGPFRHPCDVSLLSCSQVANGDHDAPLRGEEGEDAGRQLTETPRLCHLYHTLSGKGRAQYSFY